MTRTSLTSKPPERIEIEGCVLEIDATRGVLYVHHPDGSTALRICGLPLRLPDKIGGGRLMEIALKGQDLADFTFNW